MNPWLIGLCVVGYLAGIGAFQWLIGKTSNMTIPDAEVWTGLTYLWPLLLPFYPLYLLLALPATILGYDNYKWGDYVCPWPRRWT